MPNTLTYERYTPRILAEWPPDARHQSVEGAMVFCDISGFTALSERLAAKGRVGSEEVAAALTTVFSDMLEIASGYGGDLLKFGGDALLLLFTGPEHCARGGATAFEMRERLHQVGRIDTGSGIVNLDMTVGIHIGHFDLLLVGESHKELIVAGPDATMTVHTESSAEAGQIVASRAAAPIIGRSLLERAPDGRRLLVKAPQPVGVDLPTPTAGELERFQPTALRPVVGTPAGEGEHRRATVAFLKYTGLDERLSTEGAEPVWRDLDATIRIVQEAADTYGVTFFATDVDENGGKVILIAGAPATTDNDPERMMRALRSIIDTGPPLALKIGVNTGTLFAGDVGSEERAAYTVIGDAVNLAARVMGKAKPGQILAEAGVLERSETIFETEPIEAFMVKGKTQPVNAVAIGAITGTRDVSGDPGAAFVGRAGLLDVIISQFDRVADTGAHALHLSGPAGIGKSALLGEARLRTEPGAWFKVGCERYEASTPYNALRRLMRDLLNIPADAQSAEAGASLQQMVAERAPDLLPWLPLLATPIGAEVAPTSEAESLAERFRKDRTQGAVLQLLAALLPQPASLVFDNAQWLDDASQETFAHAVGDAAYPWLICLASREDPDPDFGGTGINLDGLESSEGLELARSLAAEHPVPHHRLLEAVERSGGNPLFLISLVQSAIEGGEMPANVEDLINARIDRLEPEVRKVLRYASVLGRQVDPDLLAASVGDTVPEANNDGIWDRLAEYVETTSDGGVRFRQNLFQDVAYAGLPFHVRKDLHLRVGETIEKRVGDDGAQLLARHFSLAEEHRRAWQYSVIAGDRATEEYAHVDAVDLYRKALASARRVHDLAEAEIARVAEALGTASEFAGLYEDAESAFALARKRSADDQISQGRLLGRQGLLRERSGSYPVALRWLTRGMKVLEQAEACTEVTAEKADLILAYAGVRYRQGHYHRCVQRCEEALSLEGLPAEKEAHARYLLCLAFAHLADARSETEGRRALVAFDEAGDLLGRANVLNNLGLNAYYRGEWDEAVDLWSQSREAREECGDIVGSATQTNNLGEIYSDQGKWDEARRLFTDALRIWEGAQYGVGIALACSNLGRVEARSQNYAEAETWLARARAGFEEIGAAAFVLETRLRMIENLLMARAPYTEDNARELLAEMGGVPGVAILEASLHRVLGYVLWQKGQKTDAEHSFLTSLEKAVEAASPYELALTQQALAYVAKDQDHADAAVAAFKKLGIVKTPEIPLA